MLSEEIPYGTRHELKAFSTPPDMPIPDRLNLILILSIWAGALALLWLGSLVKPWYAVILVGIAFSYLMLTNYALLHEASHENLQLSPRRNYWLGVMAGVLFPMPFSVMRSTHQGHHVHNRTDVEMFDLYYPGENRLVQTVRWYGILCGLFWPLVPVGAVLFSISPRVIRDKYLARFKPAGYLMNGIQHSGIWSVRMEMLLIILFFFTLHWLLKLHWLHTLVLYGCFSVNWSTRQYVGHAFSKRDIMEGAWNLRHTRLMSLILLNGEWDKNHHRRPDVSWYYLPRLSSPAEVRPGYLKQYLRQWLGPRPNTEPAPVVSSPEPLLAGK
ncbi:fatty acid desaturase [Pedosphaera parvula]|uniref:Fatty acid desaturase n=1 Tax=Pedosphaera parvula (strain Ellin514) TaxID=320771 RepID=B9XDY9_PEDPL|nr:fatty acid desaturase [Pedosphaera parvula]EEF61880.1 fatty acid desaturase [Pedosphaera parvula Ellin514]